MMLVAEPDCVPILSMVCFRTSYYNADRYGDEEDSDDGFVVDDDDDEEDSDDSRPRGKVRCHSFT